MILCLHLLLDCRLTKLVVVLINSNSLEQTETLILCYGYEVSLGAEECTLILPWEVDLFVFFLHSFVMCTVTNK